MTLESLQGVLGDLAGPGIDAADLYFQGQISESWSLEDGIVKEGSFNLDQGVGVRAQSGEKDRFCLQQRHHPRSPRRCCPCGPLDLPCRAERHGPGVQQPGRGAVVCAG
nr:hypothetical protein GCM10020185_19670 [Pseudomonas brassicacearum subsp. brassicacearum]